MSIVGVDGHPGVLADINKACDRARQGGVTIINKVAKPLAR